MTRAGNNPAAPRPWGNSRRTPLNELALELTRARKAEDPYGFLFEEQAYLSRQTGGGVKSASFPWSERLMADLRALAREEPDLEAARRLGEQLRRFLDSLDWGGQEHLVEHQHEKSGELRLVVRSSAAELYALPWELVTLASNGQHLADVPGLTLRYEWPGERRAPVRASEPRGGRVLFAWSSAGGAVPVEGHLRALGRATEATDFPFDVQRDVLPRVSPGALEERLRSAPEPVSVLHLLCHGAPLPEQASGLYGLAWNASGEGGGVELLEGGRLASLLAPYADTLKLVVLCACHGGDGGRLASHLGSVAQALHRVGIEMVVASRLPLTAEGSVLLAETLHEKLLEESSSLEEALGAARRRLRVGARGLDWASLQLYARREGQADLRPVVLRPYRGLLAFEPKHRRFFFGRRRLETALVERVREAAKGTKPRFQVVAGASGTGKSSVVMAGLVPLLPEREWDWLVTRPGELVRAGTTASGERSGVLQGLRERLHRLWSPEPLPTREGATRDELVEEARRLRQARPERQLLLVVDQLEEVFTQLGAEERLALPRALWALAREREVGCVVVSTLRVDHFERCGEVALEEGTRLDTVVYAEEHRTFVAQLEPEELAEVIEGPARRVGLELEPGLVERLSADVGQQPGALPLLEHALDLLWQRREGRRLTHRAYEELGELAGALTRTAEQLYEALGEAERQQARRLLVRLVALRDVTSARARGRVWAEELRPRESPGREAFDTALEKLVAHRLLVKGGAEEEGRGAWVQLAHETLLRRWERLERWVEEDWEREQQLRELEGWARDWEEHRGGVDGGASYLLTGSRLGYARGLREKHGGELSPWSVRLLEASEAAEEHQRTEERMRQQKETETMRALAEARARAARFFRSSFVVTAVLLVGAVVAVVLVWRLGQQEWLQRKAAESTARLLLAERFLTRDPTRALLFLREVRPEQHGPRWWATALEVLSRPVASAVLRGHGKMLNLAVFSPDSQRVVTTSTDGTARLWTVEGKALATLSGHEGPVYSATFSPDGQRLVTTSADATARVWSLAGEPLATLSGHGRTVWTASFSPDGQRVLTASAEGTVRVWSAQGEPLLTLEGQGSLSSAELSPDGQWVVTAAMDKTARVWSTRSRGLPTRLVGNANWVTSARFSPDGQRVVTSSEDGTVRLWSTNGKPLTLHEGHRAMVVSARFSPDGRWLVTASHDGTARVWSTRERVFPTLAGHRNGVTSARFSPDGRRLVTASMDQTARLWSAEGTLLARLEGHGHVVNQAAFSPDGRLVVTASADMTARLWSTEGKPLATLSGHRHHVVSAVFSPDGQRVLTASRDDTARLWSTEGKPLATLSGHLSELQMAAFSPDGQRVVTASIDRTARVWSARGEPLATLEGHLSDVVSAAFTPDGKRVVTASRDNTAAVWSQEGQQLARLQGFGGWVTTVAFSPEGQWVVTTSEDGTARLWPLEAGLLATSVEGASHDCLSLEERQQYLEETPEQAREGEAHCQRTYGPKP